MPEIFKRSVLLVAGMFLMTFGIASLVLANVGTTPISTLPLVTGEIFGISLGAGTFAVNVVFVLLQILLLRSRFRPISLIQVPLVFVFGLFIDLNMHWAGIFFGDVYWINLALSIFANVFLATGILFLLMADISMMPGEGLVLVVSLVTGKEFGTMKIVFDVSMVCASVVLGFAVLGHTVGIREGTVISAFAVGWLVKKLSPVVRPLLLRFLR